MVKCHGAKPNPARPTSVFELRKFVSVINILKAIKNATGTSVVFPVNVSFIHYVLVLTSVPNVGKCFTKT